jgi:hypothetical protein
MPAVMNSMCAPADAFLDALHRFFGRDTRPASGLLPAPRPVRAQLHQRARVAAVQGLCVGVGADELHARHTLVDHVVDGVAAAAANTDHLDLGALVKLVDHLDGHVSLLLKSCSCRG